MQTTINMLNTSINLQFYYANTRDYYGKYYLSMCKMFS